MLSEILRLMVLVKVDVLAFNLELVSHAKREVEAFGVPEFFHKASVLCIPQPIFKLGKLIFSVFGSYSMSPCKGKITALDMLQQQTEPL